jgi:hypothetical protein
MALDDALWLVLRPNQYVLVWMGRSCTDVSWREIGSELSDRVQSLDCPNHRIIAFRIRPVCLLCMLPQSPPRRLKLTWEQQGILTYLALAYTKHAASVLAANDLLRCGFAAA